MFFVRYKRRHIEHNTTLCTHFSKLSLVRIRHLLMTLQNDAVSNLFAQTALFGAPSVVWKPHFILVHQVHRVIISQGCCTKLHLYVLASPPVTFGRPSHHDYTSIPSLRPCSTRNPQFRWKYANCFEKMLPAVDVCQTKHVLCNPRYRMRILETERGGCSNWFLFTSRWIPRSRLNSMNESSLNKY